MKLYYSPNNEDLLFAVSYFNLLEDYILIEDDSLTKNKDGTFKLTILTENGVEEEYNGYRNVLNKIYDLCKCDPHDFDLINEDIIKETIRIKASNPKSILKKLLSDNKVEEKELSDIKNKDLSSQEEKNKKVQKSFYFFPSNFYSLAYFNKCNITLSDLLLFAKLYLLYKKGEKFTSLEFEYLKTFQNSLLQKDISIKDITEPDFDNLKIQVGKIIQIEDHPNADKLFVETVLFEDNKILSIVSGLKGRIESVDLLNKKFLFVTNLKPNKLRGFKSEGMILCVKDEEKLEVIRAPECSLPGEYVKIVNVSKDNKLFLKGLEAKDVMFERNSDLFVKAFDNLSVKNNSLFFGNTNLYVGEETIKTEIEKGEVS